ncbi:hypothetical protein AC1031_021038 [Aphanomyces cochlioides]|nr:hypothetical protein AC1031_021038 [Aphanomyces cochlioides]
MVPTFASYGSETDEATDSRLAKRPLLIKAKRSRLFLAILSATLVISSGAAIYGSFDQTAQCQYTTESLAAAFPKRGAATRRPASPALFQLIDVDASGAVNLTELVHYFTLDKNREVIQLHTDEKKAVDDANRDFTTRATCLIAGYTSVVHNDVIRSMEQLGEVLAYCHEDAGLLPSPNGGPFGMPSNDNAETVFYSRQEVIAYVKTKTTSGFFLQCTLDALDQYPQGKKFTKQDLDSISSVVLTCLMSWLSRHCAQAAPVTYG